MKHNRRAFTLIELLVVVLIIGILAAVAVPQYQKAVYKSRYATLKNLTESINQAEQVYFLANGDYTDELENLDIDLTGGTFDNDTPRKYAWDWGYCVVNFSNSNYLDEMCINTDIQMGYVITISPDRINFFRNCYVYGSRQPTDFPLQNSICQGETGLSKRSGTGAENDVHPAYVRWNYSN